MINFFIFVLAYIFLFLAIDILQRWVFTRSLWSRRATHILSGILAFFLPVYLTKNQVILIGFGFVAALSISKIIKALTLHQVKRKTWGELFYPLAIGIMPFICLPDNPKAFQFGVLMLAFADGFAGTIGELLNYKPKVIMGHTKSLGGSITFFITSLLISFFMIGFSAELVPVLLLGALFFTALEFILVYGLDNLVIPVFATWYFLFFN